MRRSFEAVLLAAVGLGALGLASGTAQAQFRQTDLVSDIPGLGTITDPNLKNTWGVSNLPGSPFWISNQGTGTSSLYTVTGGTGVAPANFFPPPATNFVGVPPGPGLGVGPTGQVANPKMSSFDITPGKPAFFIFSNLNGSISAWNVGNVNSVTHNSATVEATVPGAVFTGLAMNGAGDLLYAANGAGSGGIDVFNGSFGATKVPGGFVDPTLPSGLVPFNVEDIGGTVYVAYAPAGRAAQTMATAGMGMVATFSESGVFEKTLVPTGGELASPWGMAIAPAGFGRFGGDLLVGNFSFALSEINAFNATTGKFEGSIHVNPGANSPGGLWDLTFGNGGSGDPMTLYFTDGLNGERDGLFGAISVPEPSTWALTLFGFGGLALLAARRRRGTRKTLSAI